MKLIRFALLLGLACFGGLVNAQQQSSPMPAVTPVPHLVNFSGRVTDAQGKAVPGVSGITFAIYKEQYAGAPLWMETQNVQADARGNYTVQLGVTRSEGLPLEVFASGEGRWLGVRVQGQEEQARVLLLSVPYALKAADAATIGGLPPSAFVLAAPPAAPRTGAAENSEASTPPPSSPITGTGSSGSLPLWDSGTDIVTSSVSQTGSGSTAKIGINNPSPSTTLDVKGASTLRGALTLPAAGTATAGSGKSSQPLNLAASVFNSGTSTAVKESFQWKAEAVGNNTSTGTGSLNLLFGQGSATPSETGLNIANNGVIHFAPGQTFPGTGTGNGSVTSVGSGLGLTGGPITTSGTLAINTAVVPQLAASNTFTGSQTFNGNNTFNGNQTVNGNIGASGSISGASLSGNGALVTNVNAALLGGSAPGAFASIGSNNFTGSESIAGNATIGGTATIGGNTSLGGKLTAPNGVSLPIAYGFINSDGSVAKATSNVTCTFDATNKWYVITITGVSYFFSSFVTQVTPTYNSTVFNITGNTGSVSGNLLVQIYNSAGTPIQNPFQFVTFAP